MKLPYFSSALNLGYNDLQAECEPLSSDSRNKQPKPISTVHICTYGHTYDYVGSAADFGWGDPKYHKLLHGADWESIEVSHKLFCMHVKKK